VLPDHELPETPAFHWNDDAHSFQIIVAHSHPSGDPTPSEADIKITRDLIRAGQLLKIEVLDHIVNGNPNHSSLRALGYFYSA
jgi:DNA repair protein RadC